jgi:K+-sensing histidine kinase KdpD
MVAATNVLLRLSPSQIGTPIPFWLAICRSIIQNHGGQLWATPNQPQGAVFYVMLPTREKSLERPESSEA